MFKRQISEIFPCNYTAFLFGPRQTGKTTLLTKINSLLFIDLLIKSEQVRYSRSPELLYQQLDALAEKSGYVIIDEIQKVPSLLDEVQRCTSAFPRIHFILSGSSARKLKRGAANLLGGRALYYTLHPLCGHELGDLFSIDQAISYGSLPQIVKAMADKQDKLIARLLKSYCTTYIIEEIKEEAIVRNLDSFQRFIEVAAQMAGFEVNLSAVAEQAQLPVNSVKNYYSILEDTLLGFYLYPWHESVRKQITKTPKFYLFDNGVTRALRGDPTAALSNIERGHLFEQWVVQEIMRLNVYLEKGLKVHLWKTTSGSEVDLVLARGNQIVLAIECKSYSIISKRDASGLFSFAEEYPEVPKYICAPVDARLKIDGGIEVIAPGDLFELIREV